MGACMSQNQVARRSRTLSILVAVAMLTLLVGPAAQAALDRSGRASPAAVVAQREQAAVRRVNRVVDVGQFNRQLAGGEAGREHLDRVFDRQAL